MCRGPVLNGAADVDQHAFCQVFVEGFREADPEVARVFGAAGSPTSGLIGAGTEPSSFFVSEFRQSNAVGAGRTAPVFPQDL